jgi:pyruvate/2-oxoglutarate dehydrogenase complex dihydrolipoamide acyltransferase (E2) component
MAFELQRDLPTWRKVALSSWRASDDPAIHGWLDVDASELTRYLGEVREATGVRVTVTHLVGKAVALAFADSPECNAVASFGRLKRRDSVDVFFSVVGGDGKNLSGAKLQNADRLSIEDIARGLCRDVRQIRGDADTPLQKSQDLLRRLPAALLRPALRLTAFAMFDLGLDLSSVGVPPDPFGSAIVSNIGVFGIEQGFAPLIPAGRTAALFTIGAIRKKPIAVGDDLRVRPVLTICGTFDHRVVDGYHLGKISSTLKNVLEHPARHLGHPVREVAARLAAN